MIRRALGWESERAPKCTRVKFLNAAVVTRVGTNVVLSFLLFYVIKNDTCIDLCHVMKSSQARVYVAASVSSMKYAVCAHFEVTSEPFPNYLRSAIVCLSVLSSKMNIAC